MSVNNNSGSVVETGLSRSSATVSCLWLFEFCPISDPCESEPAPNSKAKDNFDNPSAVAHTAAAAVVSESITDTAFTHGADGCSHKQHGCKDHGDAREMSV